jgi:hypothetical protein
MLVVNILHLLEFDVARVVQFSGYLCLGIGWVDRLHGLHSLVYMFITSGPGS